MKTQNLHFQISATAFFERARDLFISERFYDAITLVKDAAEEPIENETVLAFLMGETDLDDNFKPIPAADEEYRATVLDIMTNYDLLISHPTLDDTYLKATKVFPFEISNGESTFEKFILGQKDKVTFYNEIPHDIEKTINSAYDYIASNKKGCAYSVGAFLNCHAFFFTGTQVILFEEFKASYFAEFCKVYNDMNKLIARHTEIEEMF